MQACDIKSLLDAKISRARAKQLLIELVRVPSPQTELLEEEPLLKAFIRTAIEPRLRAMGFPDIRYDAMGNLIATYGAGTSGKSLMFIGNAMNQPASTMPNPYDGDVVDGAKYDLPGDDPNVAFAEIERVAKEVEQVKDPVSGKACSVDVRLGPFMYPSLVTTESPIVRAILRASEVMLGKPVETYYSPSAFDQGYLNHVGIADRKSVV